MADDPLHRGPPLPPAESEIRGFVHHTWPKESFPITEIKFPPEDLLLRTPREGRREGGGGGSPEMVLPFWQSVAPTDLSPFMKILTRPSFTKAYLGHEDPPKPLCWPMVLLLHRWQAVVPTHYRCTQ